MGPYCGVAARWIRLFHAQLFRVISKDSGYSEGRGTSELKGSRPSRSGTAAPAALGQDEHDPKTAAPPDRASSPRLRLHHNICGQPAAEAPQNLDVYIPVIRAHTGRAVGMSSSATHLAAGRRRPAVFGAHFPHQVSGGLQEAEPPAFRVLWLRLVALVVFADLALLLFARWSARTSGVRVIPACPSRFPFRHRFQRTRPGTSQ